MLLYLFASALLLSAYLQITPKFQCDSTSLHGPVKLVISDLHVHPNLPALDYRMRQVVQQARKTWSTTGTLVLGDLMHWAGGLTFANWNLSTPEWKEMAERVKWVVDDADATYIPGNHDLNDTSTQRWNAAFGRYDRTVNLFPNATAYLSSSMAPKAHHSPVVLAHYPIEDARDPLWHPNMKLALNGHKHFIEQRKFNGTRQHTLPTLNPYQAVSNNHFDGSGEQGFALLDSSLHVKMCKVYFLWA